MKKASTCSANTGIKSGNIDIIEVHCSFLIKCTTVQWWIYIIMLKCTYLNVRKLLISKCWYFGVQYFLKSSAPQWWMQIIFMFKCYFKSEKINKNPLLPPPVFVVVSLFCFFSKFIDHWGVDVGTHLRKSMHGIWVLTWLGMLLYWLSLILLCNL